MSWGRLTIETALWPFSNEMIKYLAKFKPLKEFIMNASKISLFVFTLLISLQGVCATFTSNGAGGGDFAVGGSWVGGTAPGSNDDVIITGGDIITVSANDQCRSVTINGNGSGLVINNSVTLTLSNILKFVATAASETQSLTNNGAITGITNLEARNQNFANFSVNITGNGSLTASRRVLWLAQASGFTSTISNDIYIPSADIRFLCYNTGDLAVTLQDSMSCRRFELYAFGNTNDIQLDGTSSTFRLRTQWLKEFREGGEADFGSVGSKVYLINNYYTTGANIVFNDLHLQTNLSLSASSIFNVNGDLIIESGRQLSTNGNNMELTGNLQVDGTFSMTAGDILRMNSTAASAQTISGSGTIGITNLTMDCSNAAGGVTVNTPISITENLVCTDGTLTTNGNITMESDANGTANIGEIGGGASISGEITVEKWFNGMNDVADWVYFHVPGIPENLSVINQGGTNPSGFYTFGYPNSNSPSTNIYRSSYRYDETSSGTGSTDAERFESGWVAATNANSDQFDPSAAWVFLLGGNTGVGAKDTYHISTSIQPFPVGAVLTGSFSGGNTWQGWNLFGNPYASAVSIDGAGMLTNVQGNSLIVYDRTAGYQAIGNGGILPAFQSFFLKGNGAAPEISFSQSDKSTNSTTQIYKRISQDDELSIHITRDSGSFQGHAYIKFDSNSDLAYDGADLDQLRNNWPHPNIATVIQDSLPMMINAIPLNFDEISIPLKVEAAESDWHTLDFENIPDRSACWILEDLETGNIIDLSDQTSYRFYMEDTTSRPRFMLHISKGVNDAITTNASCFETEDAQIIASFNPNRTFEVQWFDANDNLIREKYNVQGTDTLSNIAAGDYKIFVTDLSGDCSFMEEYISVFEPAEVNASFSASTLIPNVWANEEIEFTNESSGASSFEWNFGDGSALSTETNPKHKYALEGTYVVELKASNGNSDCDATTVSVIKAEKNPPAGISEIDQSNLMVHNVDGKHFLSLSSEVIGEYDVRITNLLGQEIGNDVWNSDQIDRFELNIPSNGVFIVNVSGDNFNESIKVNSQNK